MKLNIIMKDGSILNDINVFLNKELGDSIMKTKSDFETAMNNNRTIFFSGKYIQGGFIPKQVKLFEYIEHELTIDELQAFDNESEKLATKIMEKIEWCKFIKSTNVVKLKEIVKVVRKYL